MDPAVGAALATGTGGIVSSLINAQSTWHTNKQQYEYNKKLAEAAYERNIAQWNIENAYNTPSMQVARMMAAGINPNTAYGNGAEANSGNAGTSPQLGYASYNPQAPFFDASSPIQNAFSAYMLQAKRSNIEADTALKSGQSRKVEREIDNLEVDYSIKKEQLRGLGLSNDALEIANRYIEREKEAKIANLEHDTSLKAEQERQVKFITDKILPKEVQLKDKSLQDFDEKWKKWHAEIENWASQTARNDAEKELLIKDAENYALNHMDHGFMGSGISVTNLARGRKDASKKSSRLHSSVSGDRGAHPGIGRKGKAHRGNR